MMTVQSPHVPVAPTTLTSAVKNLALSLRVRRDPQERRRRRMKKIVGWRVTESQQLRRASTGEGQCL